MSRDATSVDACIPRRASSLWLIAERWERAARERGRPTIAMETYVRLMVVKQRSGWGYETLHPLVRRGREPGAVGLQQHERAHG